MEQLLGEAPQKDQNGQWHIVPRSDYSMKGIKVHDKALRLREQMMFEVVREIHRLLPEFKQHWGPLQFDDHWVIERCLKLRPHFEHALWILTKQRQDGDNPLGVDLLQVLLTAEEHWEKIRERAENVKTMLRVACPAGVRLNEEDFRCVCTALLYNRRPYSRSDNKEYNDEFQKFLIDWGKYMDSEIKRVAVDAERVPGMHEVLYDTDQYIHAPIGVPYSYIEKVVTAKENFWTGDRTEALSSFCFKVQSRVLRNLTPHRQAINAAFADLQWDPLSKEYTLTLMEPYGPEDTLGFVPAGNLVTFDEQNKTVNWNGTVLPLIAYEQQGNRTTFAEIGETTIDKFNFRLAKPDPNIEAAPIDQFRNLKKILEEDLQYKKREASDLQMQKNKKKLIEERSQVKEQMVETAVNIFKQPLYITEIKEKFWKLSQVLRGMIDHLEIVDMQVDSCLALAMNTCTGTVMYKSLDDMLIHFGKLEPFG